MTQSPFPILFEDNHLLVVVKPPGLAVMGVPEGRETILSRAKEYVKRKYDKPGNVYIGIVSRLDAPVTGVLLMARTSKAARRLNEQFRSGSVSKRYWALVDGTIQPPQGDCVDWIRHDERHRRMHLTRENHPDAKEARLSYKTLAFAGTIALLEVTLDTGRKHQIRVQLAARKHPILGDRKYGDRRSFPAGIALHARELIVQHPVNREELRFVAPLPDCWRQFGVSENGRLTTATQQREKP